MIEPLDVDELRALRVFAERNFGSDEPQELADTIVRLLDERDELARQNVTFRAAQKACEDCEPGLLARLARLEQVAKDAAALSERLREIGWDNDDLIALRKSLADAEVKS